MKIIAVDSRKSIGAWLIKIFTFSKWNHVAVLLDNEVIDSTLRTGVRKLTLEEYLAKYPRHEIIDVFIPDEAAAKQFAYDQVGKKYDWKAILGIFLQKRNWESSDAWFCSELAESIIIAGGRRRFRSDISGVLPRETYSVI